jgi:hypothetical protein
VLQQQNMNLVFMLLSKVGCFCLIIYHELWWWWCVMFVFVYSRMWSWWMFRNWATGSRYNSCFTHHLEVNFCKIFHVFPGLCEGLFKIGPQAADSRQNLCFKLYRLTLIVKRVSVCSWSIYMKLWLFRMWAMYRQQVNNMFRLRSQLLQFWFEVVAV